MFIIVLLFPPFVMFSFFIYYNLFAPIFMVLTQLTGGYIFSIWAPTVMYLLIAGAYLLGNLSREFQNFKQKKQGKTNQPEKEKQPEKER